TSTPGIIDGRWPGVVPESIEHGHQVVTMDVVPHLLAFVPEDGIGPLFHGAFHQVGEKAVQLGAAVLGACKAASAEDARRHAEVAPVFLHHDVRSYLRSTEKTMLRLVDRHVLVDPLRMVGMVL